MNQYKWWLKWRWPDLACGHGVWDRIQRKMTLHDHFDDRLIVGISPTTGKPLYWPSGFRPAPRVNRSESHPFVPLNLPVRAPELAGTSIQPGRAESHRIAPLDFLGQIGGATGRKWANALPIPPRLPPVHQSKFHRSHSIPPEIIPTEIPLNRPNRSFLLRDFVYWHAIGQPIASRASSFLP